MGLRRPNTFRVLEKEAARQARRVVRAYPADGVRELRIDVSILGSVRICFDAEQEATVLAAGDPNRLPDIVWDGSALCVSGSFSPTHWFRGRHEDMSMEIHVPAATNVFVTFMAGVLALDGGEGNVEVHGMLGEVTGWTNSKRVEVTLQVGSISLQELHGDAELAVTLGAAELGWSRLQGTERVQVDCRLLGGIELKLPPHTLGPYEKGGFFKRSKIEAAGGARIRADVGFGGLEVAEWA